jgi:hypothetical protein
MRLLILGLIVSFTVKEASAQAIARYHIGTIHSTNKLQTHSILASNSLLSNNYQSCIQSTPFTHTSAPLNKIDIIAFPNPTNSLLNVVFSDGSQIIELRLINMSGQTVLVSFGNVINTCNVSNGLYFIEAVNENKIIGNIKINVLK